MDAVMILDHGNAAVVWDHVSCSRCGASRMLPILHTARLTETLQSTNVFAITVRPLAASTQFENASRTTRLVSGIVNVGFFAHWIRADHFPLHVRRYHRWSIVAEFLCDHFYVQSSYMS